MGILVECKWSDWQPRPTDGNVVEKTYQSNGFLINSSKSDHDFQQRSPSYNGDNSLPQDLKSYSQPLPGQSKSLIESQVV